MPKPLEVKALQGHRIWIRYEDGVQGEVDLSDIAGRGVFAVWNDRKAFESVHIGEQGAIAWMDDLDLCPDAVYLRLTGKSPEDVFPSLRKANVDA